MASYFMVISCHYFIFKRISKVSGQVGSTHIQRQDLPVGLPRDRPVGPPQTITIFINFAIKW